MVATITISLLAEVALGAVVLAASEAEALAVEALEAVGNAVC
jgi:hypothetical protein